MNDNQSQERYMVVSADCHAGADVYAYKPYLEARWQQEFDEWAGSFHDPWVDVDPGREEFRAASEFKCGVASAPIVVNWDSATRLAQLEKDGIVGEVLFPNTSPPFYPSGMLTASAPRNPAEYERRWAGVRAHNRWLADFCADAPGRRAGVAQILLNNLDDAIAEIEWARNAGLTGGVMLPAVEPGCGLPPLYSTAYERLWAACASLEVPINHHSSILGMPSEAVGDTARAVNFFEHLFFGHRATWHLMLAGVFERYPNLRFVLTELGVGWIVERLAQLDSYYYAGKMHGTGMRALMGGAVDRLPHPPSEYWKRNCYVGASFMMPAEGELRHQIGVERIMWGSDYPHSEGCYPWSREALRATFAEVPAPECRLMFGETAAQVYALDIPALRAAADRCGPTPAEISKPLENWPQFPDDTACPTFLTVQGMKT